MDEKYQEEIENFLLLIGVSKRQPAKCGICAYGDTVTITFTKVFDDDRLEDCFFQRLKEDGVPAELESNGLVKPLCWKGNYPVIEYDKNKWKKLVYLFYGVLAAMAIVLGLVNIATYDHLWWSGIAIPGIAYAGLTMRYSISVSYTHLDVYKRQEKYHPHSFVQWFLQTLPYGFQQLYTHNLVLSILSIHQVLLHYQHIPLLPDTSLY